MFTGPMNVCVISVVHVSCRHRDNLLCVVILRFLACPEEVESARTFYVVHKVEILDFDVLHEPVFKFMVV